MEYQKNNFWGDLYSRKHPAKSEKKKTSEENVADIIMSFQMVIWKATNGPLSKSH